MTLPRFLQSALLAGVVVTTIGCDQATKHLARTHLADVAPLSYLSGAVRVVLMQNEGGFLGLGSSLSPELRTGLFLLGVGGALLVAAVYLARTTQLTFATRLFAWLVWAGGLSNFVDRLLFDGRVTDFMILGLGPLRTGVFNVADVAIMAGTFFLFLAARAAPEE